MPTECIREFQLHRTIYMRVFDRRGAAATLHWARSSGFTASGVFRDRPDFCVIVLGNAAIFSSIPRLKYLPDFDFTEMALEFDLHYQGLQPIDSAKFEFVPFHRAFPRFLRMFD